MIKIVYNSNPNVPASDNHRIGRRGISFTEQSIKTFEDINSAVLFLIECTDPITRFSELPIKLDVKTVEELQAEYDRKDNELMEEYLTSQKELYTIEESELQNEFLEY